MDAGERPDSPPLPPPPLPPVPLLVDDIPLPPPPPFQEVSMLLSTPSPVLAPKVMKDLALTLRRSQVPGK